MDPRAPHRRSQPSPPTDAHAQPTSPAPAPAPPAAADRRSPPRAACPARSDSRRPRELASGRKRKRSARAMPSPKPTPTSSSPPAARTHKHARRAERRDVRAAAPASGGSGAASSQELDDDALWYDEEDDEGLDDDDEADALEAMLPRGAGGLGFDLHSLSGLLSGTSGRFRALLQALQQSAGDPSARLLALQELSEALSMATEDTLLGHLPTNAIVAELVASLGGAAPARPASALDEDAALAAALAASGGDGAGEVELYACRCLAHLLEALPAAAASVVRHGAVPLLVAKLHEITFIDLAEQVLQTLEKLSTTHAEAIVRAGGLHAMLQYVDFFSLYVQRTALATAANCCAHVTPALAARVADVMPMLRSVLGYADARLVGSAARAVCSVVEAYTAHPALLEELLLHTETVAPLLDLLWRITGTASGPALGDAAYAALLHALALAARASVAVAEALVAHDALELLFYLFTGAAADAAPSATDVLLTLAQRPPAQVREALFLAAELLPALPPDGVFDARAYTEKAFRAYERHADDDAPARRLSATAQREARATAARAAAQAAWPSFYARCTRLLLPTLLHVHAASAAPDVRDTLFDALLRLLVYCDAPTLEAHMADVPLARFLAGVLAARGAGAQVTCALQAVELLVAQLPHRYAPLLVREGALDEIARLGEVPGDAQWRARLVHARLTARLADAPDARAGLAAAAAAATRLRAARGAAETRTALDAVAGLLDAPAPATSYELVRSELVDALYELATADEAAALPAAERRALLAQTLAQTRGSAAESVGARLVRRLHHHLSRCEDLCVATPRIDGASALTQQVRLCLEADEETAASLPRAFRSLMVSIHGVATVQALHDFVRPKVEAATARRPASGLADVLAALAGEDSAASSHLLERLWPGEGEAGEAGEGEAGEAGEGEAGASASTPDATDAADATDATDATGTAAATDAAPRASYASAAQSAESTWHLALTLEGEPMPLDATLYACIHRALERRDAHAPPHAVYTVRYRRVRGAPPRPAPPAPLPAPAAGWAVALPPSVPADAPYARALQLLGALHALADEGALGDGPFVLDDAVFLNNRLTAKLAQQLGEPLLVASRCLPAWAHELPHAFPFVFSFTTRLAYFQATAFGHARLLHAYLKRDGAASDDVLPLLAQVPRQKVRIARDALLPSAVKVLELYAAGPHVLEVEYRDEVGSGLGPTLEFYALVSQALARADLGLWRGAAPDAAHADARHGLYPLPDAQRSARATALFATLGQLVAKALLDARLVDVPLHPVFWRQVLGQRIGRDTAALAQIDPALARSLASLPALPPAELDALELAYTLPGSDAPLRADTPLVTHANVHAYVRDVAHAALATDAAAAAFRTGFAHVMPLAHLGVFAAPELAQLVAHREEDWSEAALRRALVPDHGFSSESREFGDLVAILAAYSDAERRAFVQWLTGAPRLPIGGFAALQPPLTVVRRDHEPPLSPDDYLPSVMTCVNYLKLPRYSSRDTMRARLATAVREGLTSFHLS
ncbi:HECT-type E3 ubiquitin transferase [Malassezia brasiliensis]|uniref:HECT-type E3 ubiquitin transferase n=1 Tax=Malassezia brasiliensis TaxID=1821822 RepID=A0AAF0DSN0_9BASI|nr:HECT-type E3 ubiquitin transferase [Malassezia brasiliensis]